MWPLPQELVTKLVSAIALFAVGLAAGSYAAWTLTSDHYKGVIAKEEAARSDVVIQALQDQATQAIAQGKISDGVANDYEKTIADIERRYAAELDGLRFKNTVRADDVPAVPDAAVKPDAAACPKPIPADLRAQREAERNAAKLVGLQEWIKQQEALSLARSKKP